MKIKFETMNTNDEKRGSLFIFEKDYTQPHCMM